MKKIIILFLFYFSFYSPTYAYYNEPSGFRDLYWGETLQDVQKNYTTQYIKYSPEENSVIYAIELVNSNISGVYAYPSIFLSFWNNQLYTISISFLSKTEDDSKQNFKKLSNAMSLNFGTSFYHDTNPNYYYKNNVWIESCSWWGNTTNILLIRGYDAYGFGNLLVLMNPPLYFAAQKDAASKGW